MITGTELAVGTFGYEAIGKSPVHYFLFLIMQTATVVTMDINMVKDIGIAITEL